MPKTIERRIKEVANIKQQLQTLGIMCIDKNRELVKTGESSTFCLTIPDAPYENIKVIFTGSERKNSGIVMERN